MKTITKILTRENQAVTACSSSETRFSCLQRTNAMQKSRSNKTVWRGHGVEGSELVTAFKVNKCHLQGVFNPFVMSSRDEALSRMASQPASDPSCHLNVIFDTRIWVRFLCIFAFLLHQIIEILQLMSIGYSAKSSYMKSLTTFNANVCQEVYYFVPL